MKKIPKINSQMVLFKTADNKVSVEVLFDEHSVWLTENQIADLYETSRQNINLHIQNIFKENELDDSSTRKFFLQVQIEGKRQVQREVSHYNLDMIISIGYRVNSLIGTQFRQWATKHLKEFMIKGFVLDDERLKQAKTLFGEDYFRELLDRVRSIRASERRIYQQITDIFTECSIDYNKDSQVARDFFAMVQNKFHYAITGETAPEIVFRRADRKARNMGLTTWKNAPDGRIIKSDVNIAKNYLSEPDIKKLERAVAGYFDYVEDLIDNQNTFSMKEFAISVDRFLTFRNFKILHGLGSISRDDADKKAFKEYEEFNKTQKIDSDFDKSIKHIKKKDE